MSNMNRVERRSALIGGVLAVGLVAVVAVASGVGSGGLAGDRVMSWSSDGRQAYLWAIDGDQVRYLSTARTNERGNDNGGPGKGKGDDAGNEPGKDKEKDRDKDSAEPGKGKGKGKG